MEIALAYTLLGGVTLTLVLAAPSIRQRLWLSEPLVSTAAGIAVGPVALGWLDPADWGDQEHLLGLVARLTLAVSLMAVAIRVPDRFLRRRWRPLAVLLGVVLVLSWITASGLAWVLLERSILGALLLGAVIAPTDPVLASTIVTGKLAEEGLDADTRHLVSAESGANDGLAYLLVLLPVLLMTHPPGDAWTTWVVETLLQQVLGGTVLGIVIGWFVQAVLGRLSRTREHSALGIALALSFFTLGMAEILHLDGLLAVFAAGISFTWKLPEERQAEHEHMQETITRFFDVPIFLLFGMVLPWEEWAHLPIGAWWFVVSILLLRRLPWLVGLRRLISGVETFEDALLVGWFGPIGVAALVYMGWVHDHDLQASLWPIGSLVVLASIVAHGVTATPFTQWYLRVRRGPPGALRD